MAAFVAPGVEGAVEADRRGLIWLNNVGTVAAIVAELLDSEAEDYLSLHRGLDLEESRFPIEAEPIHGDHAMRCGVRMDRFIKLFTGHDERFAVLPWNVDERGGLADWLWPRCVVRVTEIDQDDLWRWPVHKTSPPLVRCLAHLADELNNIADGWVDSFAAGRLPSHENSPIVTHIDLIGTYTEWLIGLPDGSLKGSLGVMPKG